MVLPLRVIPQEKGHRRVRLRQSETLSNNKKKKDERA